MDDPFPCELEDERWWDEGLVQDFPPCGTGSLHVLPMLVTLTMEAKERRCASFVISCFQDEDFEEAESPPKHMVVQAENPCLTLRWEVLMLNQELV